MPRYTIPATYLLIGLALIVSCRHGIGRGNVEGELEIPSCELEEASYNLDVDFFTATYFNNTLTIRIQHAGDDQIYSDGVLIEIRDVEDVSENLGAGLKIEIAPPIDEFTANGPTQGAGTESGLPTTTYDSPARATLYLNETCPGNRLGFTDGDGTITFDSIYLPNKEKRIKGTFDLRFIDPRTWQSPEESGDSAQIHGEFDFNYKRSTPEQDFL